MISRKELRRQTVHMIVGLTLVLLIYLEIITDIELFVLLIIAAILSFATVRFDIPFLKEIVERYERSRDVDSFPGRGPVLMLVGFLLALRLFERDIALASMMFLSLGDAVSHLFGEHFGTRRSFFGKHSNKLIEGTIAGIVAGFLGALFFVPWYEALIGSVAAMIAEAMEIEMNKRPVDDNIIVPLAGGTAIHLLRSFLI